MLIGSYRYEASTMHPKYLDARNVYLTLTVTVIRLCILETVRGADRVSNVRLTHRGMWVSSKVNQILYLSAVKSDIIAHTKRGDCCVKAAFISQQRKKNQTSL